MDENSFLKTLGNRIKSTRLEKGLSQTELGFLCDFEKSSISRLESGRTNPTILTLKKIAAALSISLSDLIRD